MITINIYDHVNEDVFGDKRHDGGEWLWYRWVDDIEDGVEDEEYDTEYLADINT